MKTRLRTPLRALAAALGLCLLAAGTARAQWVTESYALNPGWNAIWLPLDCTHDTIDNVLGTYTQVQEVWRWNPQGSSIQYTTTPANPISPDAEWQVWRRGNATGSTLSTLPGNAAYLVKVDAAAPKFTLQLKGRPLLPEFNGQDTGTSFTGFPVASTSSSTRTIERLFSFDSVLKLLPDVYKYVGGPLSSTAPQNPVKVGNPTTEKLVRGAAYWVNAKTYTAYYGPLSVNASDSAGLDFGTGLLARTLRIRNVTESQTVTATVATAPSESAPAGQPAVAGSVPLLLQGDLDPATLTRPYTPFASKTIILAPGTETEITLYLNRTAMGTDPSKAFQSLLQVSDSLGLTRIDVPVKAIPTSLTGLWMGDATVSKVDQLADSSATSAIPLAATSSGFNVRLIVFIDAGGNATLLQQACVATDAGGVTRVYTMNAYKAATGLTNAARVSSAFFPLDLKAPGTGSIGGGTVGFTADLPFNASTNPFVHSYHPAHDNRDASWKDVGNGAESWTVTRTITLNFSASGGGSDPTWGATTLGGSYAETVTGLRAAPISASGSFILRRVSDAASLVTAQ